MQARLMVPATLSLLLCTACAHKVAFENSPLVPAVDAVVKARFDRNQNSMVELDFKHLARAKRLTPPRALYVVWAEDSNGRLFQLGQLRVNDNRRAQFLGTTPLNHFRLIVTAEDDPLPERPSLPYMLATDYFSPDDGIF